MSKGSLLSKNVVCHPATRREEEEAALDPTCTVGRVPLVGSLITTAVMERAGGILEGVFLGLFGSAQSRRAFCDYGEVEEFVAAASAQQDGRQAEIELWSYFCEQPFLPRFLQLQHQMN